MEKRDGARSNAPIKIKEVKTGRGTEHTYTSLTRKPFVINKVNKGYLSCPSSQKMVKKSGGIKVTPPPKSFTLSSSTRQNTMDSDELDKVSAGKSQLKGFTIKRNDQKEKLKRSVIIKPFQISELNKPKRKFTRSVTEALISEEDCGIQKEEVANYSPSNNFQNNTNKEFDSSFGHKFSSERLISCFETKPKEKEAKVTFSDEKEPYYHGGLIKYALTGDQKFSIYYRHFAKSVFALKEIHSDFSAGNFSKDEIIPFRRKKSHVLALDLDETLIHCCNYDPPESQRYKFAVNYNTESGAFITAKINVRPHLQEFLETVSKHYDIVIFTASEREYALSIINFIDPQRKYISDLFDREFCTRTRKGFVVKDLRVVLPEELNKIVLVDNSVHCFAPQINNGIPILSFYSDEQDSELLKLRDFLLELRNQQSLQDHLHKTFKLMKYAQYTNTEELLNLIIKEFHST